MTQRVHIPSAEYWSGHAVLTGIHNIGFYEELSKITRIVRESDYSPASQLFLQGEKKQ